MQLTRYLPRPATVGRMCATGLRFVGILSPCYTTFSVASRVSTLATASAHEVVLMAIVKLLVCYNRRNG